MKRFFSFVLFLLLISAACSASATEKLTASQWSHLSEQRKLYYVFGQMDRYEDDGIVFGEPARTYLDRLDAEVKTVPAQTDMDDLFKSFAETGDATPPLKKN